MIKVYDWDAITGHPKFLKLQKKKTRFLFGWWIFAAINYFLLLLGAGYAPELFKVKLIGPINVGFTYALFQFLIAWGIAIYYAHKANREFDQLTRELVDELEQEGQI